MNSTEVSDVGRMVCVDGLHCSLVGSVTGKQYWSVRCWQDGLVLVGLVADQQY